ncbi:hypothetical protein [Thiohalophilus sp.]|uniref:hypothetical protein n=1 Tax=Thiohalophilus sp. TaxID=3028392 RepID=UPI002ACE378D|nr:hypothetical protein [Thiohalophilus sp.]MDZ7805291.1 hypothetical protein [Thiohalophilus sp.]
MFYTIEVELDYDTHPYEETQNIWDCLHRELLAAGFRADCNRFTIHLPQQKARQLARRSMEQLEHQLRQEGRSLYHYLREFYGYPTNCADNLLLPPTSTIEVRHRFE